MKIKILKINQLGNNIHTKTPLGINKQIPITLKTIFQKQFTERLQKFI